jgi:hypothetical protein
MAPLTFCSDIELAAIEHRLHTSDIGSNPTSPAVGLQLKLYLAVLCGRRIIDFIHKAA